METNKQRIFNLMMDCKWHSTVEIMAVGGSGAMRRLRELRQAIRSGVGYPVYLEADIKKIKDVEQRSYAVGSLNQLFEYRFSKQVKVKPKDEPTKITVGGVVVAASALEPFVAQPAIKDEEQPVAVEAATLEIPVAQSELDKKKEWDRESYIVQRQVELEELTGRSRMVPVRSLASSRLPLVGGDK